MTGLSAIAHAPSRLKKENARFISQKTTELPQALQHFIHNCYTFTPSVFN